MIIVTDIYSTQLRYIPQSWGCCPPPLAFLRWVSMEWALTSVAVVWGSRARIVLEPPAPGPCTPCGFWGWMVCGGIGVFIVPCPCSSLVGGLQPPGKPLPSHAWCAVVLGAYGWFFLGGNLASRVCLCSGVLCLGRASTGPSPSVSLPLAGVHPSWPPLLGCSQRWAFGLGFLCPERRLGDVAVRLPACSRLGVHVALSRSHTLKAQPAA